MNGYHGLNKATSLFNLFYWKISSLNIFYDENIFNPTT